MKTSIELTEDFYVHLARGLWLSGYLVKIGKCICKLVSERAKFQGRFADYEEFGLLVQLKSENTSGIPYLRSGIIALGMIVFSVQRWYSGIFGIGTMNWFTQSNTMHKIWELNQDLMKQKYRMHNLYVQVSNRHSNWCTISHRKKNSREYQKNSCWFGMSVMDGNLCASF